MCYLLAVFQTRTSVVHSHIPRPCVHIKFYVLYCVWRLNFFSFVNRRCGVWCDNLKTSNVLSPDKYYSCLFLVQLYCKYSPEIRCTFHTARAFTLGSDWRREIPKSNYQRFAIVTLVGGNFTGLPELVVYERYDIYRTT